jgi:hypothetical protein
MAAVFFYPRGACASPELPHFVIAIFVYAIKSQFLACFFYPLQGRTGALNKARRSRAVEKCGTAWRTIKSPLKINAPNL